MAIGVNLFYNSMGKAVPWRKTARLAAPNGPFYTAKRPILQCRGATSASGCGTGRKAIGARRENILHKTWLPPRPWQRREYRKQNAARALEPGRHGMKAALGVQPLCHLTANLYVATEPSAAFNVATYTPG